MPSPNNDRGALKVLSNLPPTPARQVKVLKEELEKKETENDSLKNNISDLTKALNTLQLVKDKVADLESSAQSTVEEKGKGKGIKKKAQDAPAPAKTAYRFFAEDNKDKQDEQQNEEGGNKMKQLWSNCQGEERKKYLDLAREDKKRFEKENEIYKKQEEALQIYYEKQKQELAMEFYEAHILAQATMAAEKKSKKVKDPNAPKAAMSSYMYFSLEKRESIKAKNPELGFAEVSKLVGEEWAKAKASKRGVKKYENMADKDKKRYLQEKEAYDAMKQKEEEELQTEKESKLQKDKEEAMKLMMEKEVLDKAQTSQQDVEMEIVQESYKAKSKKKKKDPLAPKAPSSSYMFFCKEMRDIVKARNPGLPPVEITKILGEEWGKIKSSDLGRMKYDELAKEDKVRYETEKVEYEKSKNTASTK